MITADPDEHGPDTARFDSVAEGIQAGSWRRTFARRGVTLHQADCLIAAAAVGVAASLATANVADFPITEVDVQYWPTGG